MDQPVTTISGLASGLQTDDIIAQLIQLERQPIVRLQNQQARLRTKQSAFQELNTRLSALQDAAKTLGAASFYQRRTATSADPKVLLATAEAGALAGDYSLTVDAVARAHQVKSGSFADLDVTRLQTGTLQIVSGTQTTTVTLDDTNNTLNGLRDAINAANTNVRAAIVQDGDASYRLVISARSTGTANALTITNKLTGGTGSAVTLTDLQAAADAQVTLGAGAGAITVTRSTNHLVDVIPGATLDLLTASATPVNVTVAQDTTGIEDAVKKLVEQYNNAHEFVNSQSSFNSDTGVGGILLGDRTLADVQSSLLEVFSGAGTGLSAGAFNTTGLSLDGKGKLVLNEDTLHESLVSDPDGVLRALALSATSTSSLIQFIGVGPRTVVSGAALDVTITQAATQARVTGGVAQSGPLDADETLTINSIDIALTAGMTQAQVLAAINARSAELGVRAYATASDGTGTGTYLSLVSRAFGGNATFTVSSSVSKGSGVTSGIGKVDATPASPGGEGGAGTGAVGVNVAGTINGEAATGLGQVLTGNVGNAVTEGLRLRITAAAPGNLGTITLTHGIASLAQKGIEALTDDAIGPIQVATDGLDDRIEDIDDLIEAREAAVRRKEAELRRKFAALESALSQTQSQSNYLASQLNGLSAR
jgi:flagellar hook-associated protein 2